jgi:peptidoglycan lytic transglycosylase
MKGARPFQFFLLLVGMIFSTGCATYSFKSPERPPTPSSPPITSTSEPYHEVGLASWYGPGFYGRKTASGDRFKKKGFTCAHRTLPFGTQLLVTNLENGKSVEVIVNDRGPFIRNKIIDLSYAAAKEIGILKMGRAKVELKNLLAEEEKPETLPATSSNPLLCKERG